MPVRRSLALALLLVLPLAACGDDGGDDGGSGSGSGSASGSASGADDDASGTDDADSTDDDSTDDDSTDDDGGEASGDFCDEASAIAVDESINDIDIDDPAAVALALERMDAWAGEAPDDVAEDIREVNASFEEMVELIGNADLQDDPEALAQFEAVQDRGRAASDRVEDFVQEACGVDLSGDG
jgi:hypothetical protein